MIRKTRLWPNRVRYTFTGGHAKAIICGMWTLVTLIATLACVVGTVALSRGDYWLSGAAYACGFAAQGWEIAWFRRVIRENRERDG